MMAMPTIGPLAGAERGGGAPLPAMEEPVLSLPKESKEVRAPQALGHLRVVEPSPSSGSG